MRSEFVISHTDDMHCFDCMHQLCGLIINWSDQQYADSKLQCHCEQQQMHTSFNTLNNVLQRRDLDRKHIA